MRNSIRAACAVGATLAAMMVVPSHAAPVTFFGQDLNTGEAARLVTYPNASGARTNFLSNLVGVGTENFESLATGAPVPIALSFPGSAGAITATLSGSGFVSSLPGAGTAAGRYPTSGTKFLQEVNANSGTTAFSLTFSSAVAAFGFYGTDFGDFNGVTSLDLIGANGTQNVSIGNAINIPGGSLLFFGVIDAANPFTQVVFRNSNPSGGDFFGFDDMTVGDVQQVVPTPDGGATFLLLSGVLFGFVALRRRIS